MATATLLDTPDTDTVLDTTDTPVLATTTARGLLRLSPPLLLRLMPRLIPTTTEDTTAMVLDTPATTVLDTAPTDTVLATTATATATATTARGPLRPSLPLRLRPRLIPTTTEDTM